MNGQLVPGPLSALFEQQHEEVELLVRADALTQAGA